MFTPMDFDDEPLVSIGGSSDPAIVGKVLRCELRQMVARN